ncbi:MAG: sigma factor G inhibitor Gin [Firmicutes bacterium]|nr:sigma factor G inhibitor Gin [Bacillota bacterium]
MAEHGCVICGAGPGPGLCVRGHYICIYCEENITLLSPDNLLYEIYRSGLKRIWRWA